MRDADAADAAGGEPGTLEHGSATNDQDPRYAVWKEHTRLGTDDSQLAVVGGGVGGPPRNENTEVKMAPECEIKNSSCTCSVQRFLDDAGFCEPGIELLYWWLGGRSRRMPASRRDRELWWWHG